ncbi:hypothetical protein B0T14DRAFT_444779 [Immersiella caudata]|uniref:Uncharacterized protein n=1 Tax=Immersiella caudata TaxID=314043 RepID=A0AA40CBI4_9PEZI|nr:hypothetical protein B0T14DRAFT_444779 [Immersiella caudata]
MLTSVGRWLGIWVPSESGHGADTPSSIEAAEKAHHTSYQPSIADVLVIKSMLTKGLHLPLELVESIVDQAEYWPRTTTEVDYKNHSDHGLYTVGFSQVANDSENELLLRSVPLGFHTWPPKSPSLGREDLYRTSIPPKPPGEQFPADAFQSLMNYPAPLVNHPCRKIVFTIRSRDQGWGGSNQHHFTYHGSWTWFEAGLERWAKKSGENLETQEQPSLALEDLSTVYPPVILEGVDETAHKFDHPLLPVEHLKIQCNKTAVRDILEHRVVWNYTDEMSPETNLADLGRGTETGDGKFVRELQLGDVVTVWGKNRFPGWANYVEGVKIEVYWVV